MPWFQSNLKPKFDCVQRASQRDTFISEVRMVYYSGTNTQAKFQDLKIKNRFITMFLQTYKQRCPPEIPPPSLGSGSFKLDCGKMENCCILICQDLKFFGEIMDISSSRLKKREKTTSFSQVSCTKYCMYYVWLSPVVKRLVGISNTRYVHK